MHLPYLFDEMHFLPSFLQTFNFFWKSIPFFLNEFWRSKLVASASMKTDDYWKFTFTFCGILGWEDGSMIKSKFQLHLTEKSSGKQNSLTIFLIFTWGKDGCFSNRKSITICFCLQEKLIFVNKHVVHTG